uniref:WD_REPEATS_REGION domain-containing protein n=1 Tax=Macrostomum lignano TaxID=282301 RepID=A0A1I8F828_9PLAT
RVSQAYLPFQSKFVYIGTTQGNVYLMNIETFRLSGYIINWNKVIGMLQSVHPGGAVAHIAECPVDSNKLLIGFRKGLTGTKREALRFKHTEDLCSVSWHHEGRMFISSHIDGSLVKWSLKNPQKPEVTFPHGRRRLADFIPTDSASILAQPRVGKTPTCSYLAAGSPLELSQPCVNIQLNNHIDVLQMEHDIVDIVPCATRRSTMRVKETEWRRRRAWEKFLAKSRSAAFGGKLFISCSLIAMFLLLFCSESTFPGPASSIQASGAV